MEVGKVNCKDNTVHAALQIQRLVGLIFSTASWLKAIHIMDLY
jgi:hypothetical protein